MKTITEIELTSNQYDSLCFIVNYDNKYDTFLSTKEEVETYLDRFINEEITTDYVLFKRVA